jgi:2-succinyl-5-enolpyruvyl-6-hydroxy-3-cyclohexene-1-carboxylate synthase
LNTDKTHIRHLAEICFQKGVTRFVISPGSRSTPIIIALSRHEGIEMIPIVDERSAAFFALGMAQQSGQPVGLVCTSGSAALNYSPAIAEAYYQKIPLIVFTADRPKEWIDQQDGQTIRQQNVYQNYIVKSFELPAECNSNDDLWLSDRIVNEAINIAILNQGPVHVNVPLKEPLNRQVDVHHEEKLKIIASPQPSPKEREFSISHDVFEKIMILGGNGIFQFSNFLNSHNFLILSEITCNLNVPSFKNIDALITSIPEDEAENYRPDLLITFGGAIVSKKLKEFLRKYQPKQHWHLSDKNEHIDTFQCLTHVLQNTIEFVIEKLENLKIENSDNNRNKSDNYQKLWNDLSEKVKNKQQEFLFKTPFSDFKAYHSIFQHLTPNFPNHNSEIRNPKSDINLHLGNSSPVRYASYFDVAKEVLVNSNRGVSGIDGTVSTAAGAAYVNNKLTILITGDLAFMYYSNGLWNPKLPSNLRVIVINNQGGNIFRIINDDKNLPELNEYFETPHSASIEHICKGYFIPYYFCDSENGLQESLKVFFEPNGKSAVLEIKTDSKLSAEVFKEFISTLKK